MDENILFDDREEGKFKSSNEALIKACTIYKLIERLTYHEYAGEFHQQLLLYNSTLSDPNLNWRERGRGKEEVEWDGGRKGGREGLRRALSH